MSKALMKQSKGKSKFSILLYTRGFLYPQLFLNHIRHLKNFVSTSTIEVDYLDALQKDG